MRVLLRAATMRGAVGFYGLVVGFLVGKIVDLPLGKPSPNDLYTFFKDQGSLIAGGLAVGAAWMTVRGTMRAAQREIEAANRQISTTLMLERRREASQQVAFAGAMEIALQIVLREVEGARELVQQTIDNRDASRGLLARKSFSRTGFEELRTASISIGGVMPPFFLNLDNAIATFADPARGMGNLTSDLDEVVRLATNLKGYAEAGHRRSIRILTETQAAVGAP